MFSAVLCALCGLLFFATECSHLWPLYIFLAVPQKTALPSRASNLPSCPKSHAVHQRMHQPIVRDDAWKATMSSTALLKRTLSP